MSPGKKLKILLVGPIGSNVPTFAKKLSSLQSSKAGPFDLCFAVGPVDASIEDDACTALPLPVYLQDYSHPTAAATATATAQPDGTILIAPNLFAFPNANVYRLEPSDLVVAVVPPLARDLAPLQTTLAHASYVGCDLLLSSEWPQGAEALGMAYSEIGSFDVAHVALQARARYHVAPSARYVQSNPFQHLASATTTAAETIDHTGRFIGIAKVSTPTDAAPKPPKYIHALGLTPLHNMASNQELVSTTPNIQPNPFTDASYERDGTSRSNQHVGLSEAQARRIMGETNRGHDYRWTATTTKRGPVDETSVDETITTLFLHGLHKDVTNRLQTGSGALLQAFDKYKVLKVRRPPAASSYAFLEFDTHAHAQHCLHDLAGEITIAGIHLTLKWASQGGQVEQRAPKRPRLTEQDAKASSTLYFRLPPSRETDPEQLRKYMETTLEQALGGDVTAETEPALQVSTRLAPQTNFGFMEFASHAAASMVLATLTGSTDGGSMVSTEDVMIPEGLLGILLFWAPDKAAATPTDQTMTTASGVVFSRQHFPADSRQDCWFCLASPGCEKHLITSVFQQCYLAMPKGPIHPGHVLIIPVTHTSQGALSDASLQEELADLKQRLYRHAKEQYQCDLFVWERAIQTKGGYHTHLQCVPVATDMALQLSATITALAKKSGFALREINSDLGLQALIQEGYFYAEIISTHTKRFLHPAEESSRVPLQFGREVLAVVMDRPELAHWKACVLDKEKEQELALEFRKSFETYEPKDDCDGEPKIVQQDG